MISVLLSALSSLGLDPGQGHCVVFLGKALLSQCFFLPRRCIKLMGGAVASWLVRSTLERAVRV